MVVVVLVVLVVLCVQMTKIHLGREGRARKDEVTVHVHGIVCQDG